MLLYPKGRCSDMCPPAECKWRKQKNMVHTLEMDEKGKKVPDDTKMVKQFVRSAAGQNLSKPEILRNPVCLLRTVKYLLTEIINKTVDWRIKYEFVSDRLRSVRQDAIIQNIEPLEWLQMLPSMIRFHCYATYRLRNDDVVFWDTNLKCLTDCFTTLMDVYERLTYSATYDVKEKQEMETLYSLINIESFDIISKYSRNFDEAIYPPADIILCIFKDFVTSNYTSIFKNIQRLPIIHQCSFFSLHVQSMKRIMFARILASHSSGNQSFKYPISKMMKILQYDSVSEFVNVCLNSNVQLSDDKSFIIFSKPKKQIVESSKCIKNSECKLLEKLLANVDVSSILLNLKQVEMRN